MLSKSLALIGVCTGLAGLAFPASMPASAATAASPSVKVCRKCKRRYTANLIFGEQDGSRLAGPPQPVEDAPVAAANGKVVVSWKGAASDETGFEVFRRADH